METTSKRRDQLYNSALVASVLVALIIATIVAIYKLNEDYFADNSRLKKLVDSISTRANEESYPKVNIKVNFSEGADKSLVITLEDTISSGDVSVRDEFIENKCVITLSGYEEVVTRDIDLVGDLSVIEAAGAYSQNGNVVVEVFCNNSYDYDIVVNDKSVIVKFSDIESEYDYKGVIWVPYSDQNRLGVSMFKDELEEYGHENRIKLYLTSELETEYDQGDIIEYANDIGANLVIGIETMETKEGSPYITGICNMSYFRPDYDSTRLAVNIMGGFAKAFNYDIEDFEDADDNTPLVYEATVPSALIRLSITENEMATEKAMYNFYENIYYGIENTLESVLAEWRYEDDESE